MNSVYVTEVLRNVPQVLFEASTPDELVDLLEDYLRRHTLITALTQESRADLRAAWRAAERNAGAGHLRNPAPATFKVGGHVFFVQAA